MEIRKAIKSWDYRKIISYGFFTIALWLLIIRQIIGQMGGLNFAQEFYAAHSERMLQVAITLLLMVIVFDACLQVYSVYKNTAKSGTHKQVYVEILRFALELVALYWSYRTVAISGTEMMFLLMFLVIAARYIDNAYIVKAWLVVAGPIIVIDTVYCLVAHDMSNSNIVLVGTEAQGSWVRWRFLFSHSNGYGIWATFVILAGVYFLWKRYEYLSYLLLLVGTVFLWKFPNCKTDSLILLGCALLLFICKRLNQIWKKLMLVLPIACTVVVYGVVCLCYSGIIPNESFQGKNPFWTMILRFQDAAANLYVCPLNLWGQKMTHLGTAVMFNGMKRVVEAHDCAFVSVLIYYGWLLGIILIVTMIYNIYRLLTKQEAVKSVEICLLFVAFAIGSMEFVGWYGMIAFPLLFMGKCNLKEKMNCDS